MGGAATTGGAASVTPKRIIPSNASATRCGSTPTPAGWIGNATGGAIADPAAAAN
jgi:hypothetical protein